ncbi:hypothetical protein D0809_00065 [Flavobacterium circumlabens]|uniref:Uncharacterized protein n=2 Tax=Flavobacterium circumlabens TaxID=2133765 RepID=A0A4Y7UGG1_9FLAO|nr:hypothetical protein D0809_00065 [Flavobacterium circumlabens]
MVLKKLLKSSNNNDMKNFYFVLVFLVGVWVHAQTAPIGSSIEVGVTEGQLAVSLTGAANYTIPIAVPPGINGVVPQISLTYNSQGGNGIAGYGWSIGGISAISRIPSTKFHDGTIDPVDFDALDRFALDGQRLLVKNGTNKIYGLNGTAYETESFSNIKITSYGVHSKGINYGPAYFIVEYPDGSKAYYGSAADSCSITDWAITYWENPQGVRISYTYFLANNTLNISTINYGSGSGATPINQIKFIYKQKERAEQEYVGGQSMLRNTILDKIQITGNGVGFRNYALSYDTTSLGYQRLTGITEKNGDNSKEYKPTVFEYHTEAGGGALKVKNSGILDLSGVSFTNAEYVSGDFDGDGQLDLILYPTKGDNAKKEYSLYTDITTRNVNFGTKQSVGSFQEIFPVTWLGYDRKVMPGQAWVVVKENSFTTYFQGIMGIVQYDEKKYDFPVITYFSEHPLSCVQRNRKPRELTAQIAKSNLSGDFDGDGITDIIVVERNTSYSYLGPCDSDGQVLNATSTHYGTTYLVNLDKNVTSNFVTDAGRINAGSVSKLIVADFNGDGKSDVYVFDQGKVAVYELNDKKQFELLFVKTDEGIVLDKQILMGDYNGDGKTDFVIPQATNTDSWNFYFSTGTTFSTFNTEIGLAYYTSKVGYYGVLGYPLDTYSLNEGSFVANDFNGDGKTDILYQQNLTVEYILSEKRNIYARRGESQVTKLVLLENTSGTGNTITFNLLNTNAQFAAAKRYPIPIFTNHNKVNLNLEYSLISDNAIQSFNSATDHRKDVLLEKVTTGNGVTESITYSALKQDPYETIYSPAPLTETYPNIDIKTAVTFKVVKMLEKTSAAGSKKQSFNYYGAVANSQGLGFLGFRAAMRTNWYKDNSQVIATISRNDVGLRGANTENYSVLGFVSANYLSDTFITKSAVTYNTAADALQSNKVFKLKALKTEQVNTLEGTGTETVTDYDGYNNPLKSTTVVKEGKTILQSTVTTIAYNVPSSANTSSATPYIVGQPISKNQSITVAGKTMSTEELYSYSGNLLTQVKKKGTNTDYITEDNQYDRFGNIIKKTILATGLAPRITSYLYDASGRFLIRSTDIEGLSTNFIYNQGNGLLLSETNPYGLTTSYDYDSWFKKIKTTDYLGKNNTYSYARNGDKTTITATAEDGSSTVETFDDLGRKIREGSKNIAGTFSYVDYDYDIYDRNYKVSEPYFGNVPTQWNETKYDIYGRVTEHSSFTGKTTRIIYSGLSTTVNDGTKSKTTVKDAIGNVVAVTDTPGGTITYTYFPNGNLYESSYAGVKTTISQDGWGRKTELVDSSAGTYRYEYNALGETTKETTPNGTTNYTLDAFGKVTQKTIFGTKTDSKTTYTYDPSSKLLLSSKFEDFTNGAHTILNSIIYDASKRITKTTEQTPYAVFTKEFSYDGFGRVASEKSSATAGGKSSSKTIKNTYKNGAHWQILDNDTNAVLWQTNAVNARGQLTSAQNGPTTVTNTYGSSGLVSQLKYDRTAGSVNILTLNTDFDAKKGNLNSRTNSMFNRNESFDYDSQDRLTDFTNGQGVQEKQAYDDQGRITQNNLGTYQYTQKAKPYQQTSINPVEADALSYYANREGIYSDGMEEKSGFGLAKYPASMVYTYDTANVHTGKTALKIANTTTTEQYLHSDKWIAIDNAVATSYTYSAWVYSDNPQAEIFLFMKKENEAGYFTGIDNAVSGIKKQWTKIEKTVLVPANIKKLNIRLDNNGLGNVWFDDVQIRKTGNPVTADRELNISCNTFKSPVQIDETGVDKISFTYNDSNGRSTMFYGGLEDEILLRPLRKYYAADGSMEIKHNRTTGTFEFITYIGGDGYSAPIVLRSNGTTSDYLYLQRDYQGSILSITNQAGAVIEKRLFDAWGNIAKVPDGAGNTLTGLTVLDRGYTGHEHLQSVGLINMNGRIYDPKLHRFLQPDNFVQDPFNTQSYNRYGYCWNNPLVYTDPSGEIVPLIVVGIIVVSAAINVYQNWNDITGGTGKFSDINWGKFAGFTASGAIAGALTVYGGPYGVVWAGAAQNFLNSAVKGDDLMSIGRNTLIGAGTGFLSYGIGVGFDKVLPAGILGTNTVTNSILTGATKEVGSSFAGNLTGNIMQGDNFEDAFKKATDPAAIASSFASGAFGGYISYSSSTTNLSYTRSATMEYLELQSMPYRILPYPVLTTTFTIQPPRFQFVPRSSSPRNWGVRPRL